MKVADYTLYLVTDALERYPRDMLSSVDAAVAGGVTLVQYRAGAGCGRRRYEEALALRDMLASRNVPLIINDAVDLALAVRAAGVHLGQQDLPVDVARRLLGDDAIIGLSITAQPQLAEVDGNAVDYLGVGPVFSTASKDDAAPAIGLDGLRGIVKATRLPCVAIGGIDVARAPSVFATGVAGIAVISALSTADAPEAVAHQLRAARGIRV